MHVVNKVTTQVRLRSITTANSLTDIFAKTPWIPNQFSTKMSYVVDIRSLRTQNMNNFKRSAARMNVHYRLLVVIPVFADKLQ